MAKRTYPGLDRVKDDPVRVSLRGLWDRIFTVQELLETLQSQQLTQAQVQGLIAAAIAPLSGSISAIEEAGAGSSSVTICDPLTDGGSPPDLIYDSFGAVIMTCHSE